MGHKCVVYADNNPLSHLAIARLGAVEQRWAAQLASFDFELRYRSGKSNCNADALSRQQDVGSLGTTGLAPGLVVPFPLQQVAPPPVEEATLAATTVLPGYPPDDIRALQNADPVIQEVMAFETEAKP